MAAAERSPERLLAEMKLVERVLRLKRFDPDDPECYGRPPRGPRSRFQPVPHVPSRDEQPDPPQTQQFERDVIRFVDRQLEGVPGFLVRRVPLLLWRMPSVQQWCVELVYRRGMSYRQAAEWKGPWGRMLGVRYRQVGNILADVKETIARQCWADDGTPIFG